MQRAGNRRYYRPADVELARRIHRLLNQEGYTVRGVQKLLREQGRCELAAGLRDGRGIAPRRRAGWSEADEPNGVDVFRLIALRNRLADALDG